MKKKNRGFTLIELIVTVAIMAIFSGVVLSMIGTGANSYRKTSSTAKAQMETQDVMDQIQNMIIDVNRSVYYSYGKGINEGYGDEIRNDIDSGDSSQSKTFFACSATELDAEQQKYSYSCDIIEWDSDEQKLYYGCRVWEGVERETTDDSTNDGTESQSAEGFSDNAAVVSDDSTDEDTSGTTIVKSKRTSDTTTKVKKTLLAEDITNFCVDVSKAQNDRIVRFQFTTNKKGKEITTLHTVNLRNQVQISKPGDGYGSAQNGNAWIKITNYPPEINPGQKLSGFSKLMNGNIDPSTVQWFVETGKGSFSGTDDIDLALTAADNASGEIRIYVQAQTTDGKTVKSEIVGIKVNSKTPTSLQTTTGELLLAVGPNYSLNDLVKWKIAYSDNTNSEQLDAVQWTTTSGIVTLNSDGTLIVPDTLGTGGNNSSFTATASYTDSTTNQTLTGDISVKLARLDLIQPTGILYVGDTMPFEYEYREGGNVISDLPDEQITKSIIYKGDQNAPGGIGKELTDQDAGDWTAKAVVDVRSRGGYGTLTAEGSFKVEARAEECEITGKDIVLAGESYSCSYYNERNFYPNIDRQNNHYYQLTWNIVHKSDTDATDFEITNIVSSSTGNGTILFDVDENGHGFVLELDVELYDYDKDGKQFIKKRYHGSKSIKVITKEDLVIENPIDNDTDIAVENYTVTKECTYRLPWSVYIWQYDESAEDKHKRILYDGISEEFFSWSSNLAITNKLWKVNMRESQKVAAELTLSIGESTPTVMVPYGHWGKVVAKQNFIVQEPELAMEVVDENNQSHSEIYPDDTITLTANITVNGKEYTPVGWTWKCLQKDGDGEKEIWVDFKDGGANNKKVFTPPDSKIKEETTYIIRVFFTLYNGDTTQRQAEYRVTVKPFHTTARVVTVNGKTSIFPEESVQIYLELMNEKGMTDGYVTWSYVGYNSTIVPDSWNSTIYQQNIYQNKQFIPITLTASKDITSTVTTTVTANYTATNGDTGTASIDITVTPLTMFLKHRNDSLYFGMNPEQITAEVYDGENDINVTENYDIEWSVSPEDDSYEIADKGNPTLLSIKKNLDKAKEVTVTAAAKDKESGKTVCTASTKISINNKKTIVKTYSCAAGQVQPLEFNNDNLQINEITTSYTTSSGTTVSCSKSSIPTLTMSETGNTDVSITMNSDASDFANYKYILISVDTDSVLYNFYIYPVQNNVYDSSNRPFVYVPRDVETIKKMATLISDDNKNGDQYTYVFYDVEGARCELRLSISKKPGLGIISGFAGSSMGKWFMKRIPANNKNIMYYRYDNGWYLFQNSTLAFKAWQTKYYWNLDDSIKLWDLGSLSNTTFWQKWD